MPLRLRETERRLKVLDFDIENRPLSYLGADYTTAEVTVIAASWVGNPRVMTWALELDDFTTGARMLACFRHFYELADVVTGHYIRAHDLPVLNGAYLELGHPPLPEKLTQDTKLDLVKRRHLSASQEALAGMLGLPEPKHHMSQTEWREANRLTWKGIQIAKERCRQDVVQHKALRERLLAIGALGPPKVWRP